MLQAMSDAIQDAIRRASRQEEYASLAGEEIDGGYWAVEHTLERALEQVRELRGHAHQWDSEDGFCTVCGADGAA